MQFPGAPSKLKEMKHYLSVRFRVLQVPKYVVQQATNDEELFSPHQFDGAASSERWHDRTTSPLLVVPVALYQDFHLRSSVLRASRYHFRGRSV